LGFDAPSSLVVGLALRHTILPKNYGEDYGLNCDWGTYGLPQYLFTDGGKDFRSNHLAEIATQLGFVLKLRDRLKPDTFPEVRDISDKLEMSVVLVGTDRLDAVMKRDEQVYNRFRSRRDCCAARTVDSGS
jgi:hypothetical protein